MVEWIRHNTQGITEAARQVLYLLLGFEVLRNQRGEPWTDAQTGLVLAALSALLTLIAAKTNVAAPKVEARVVEARAKGRAEGTSIEEARAEGLAAGTGTGSGYGG
jgi:hypothetical protein